MMGHAAHRHPLTFGESDIQQARHLHGILEKHLVKIAQTEKENGAGRQFGLDLPVLPHHGS